MQHRPGTYFWCPGNALDRKGIALNLEAMHKAGIGTAHIVPIYGARGYEDRYIDYLSPQWMRMLDDLVAKADELGMQVDMTTGCGWCFGGPNLPTAHEDTRVRWQGAGKPLRLIQNRAVKRAAPGGEGSMLNPYSPDAMRHYLQRFTEVFAESDARKPLRQYHDSFEYSANWSADLFEQFQDRRGYDLKPHLETFFDKTTDSNRAQKARLKYDYRRTLSELHGDAMSVWADWARQHGMETRNQAHGTPANLLDIYALADTPETEMFGAPKFPVSGFRRDPRWCRDGDNDRRIMQMASSAAHVAHPPGRQLVASESFTWLRNHWHTTLGQMKLSADLFFLAGVNRMYYHGTCYSPPGEAWPGWFFYASTQANWRNSIWQDIGYLNGYIARCQSVLQAGRPANDVLIYWPIHDLWMNSEGMQQNLTVHSPGWMANQPVGRVARQLHQTGYAYDFISDRMLSDLRVEDGWLLAPGGRYRAIVVPACRFIPAATACRLAEMAEAGAAVIFESALPEDMPGLADVPQRREVFREAEDRLKKTARVTPQIAHV